MLQTTSSQPSAQHGSRSPAQGVPDGEHVPPVDEPESVELVELDAVVSVAVVELDVPVPVEAVVSASVELDQVDVPEPVQSGHIPELGAAVVGSTSVVAAELVESPDVPAFVSVGSTSAKHATSRSTNM